MIIARARSGTDYERIWRVVARIPRGSVATYGAIARIAGLPNGARRVGYALHSIPHGLPLPWHRVLNARGMIAFPPAHPHHAEQKRLLEEEGIVFRRGRLDLATVGWKPRKRR